MKANLVRNRTQDSYRICNAPQVVISNKLRKHNAYDPNKKYSLHYSNKRHHQLPHIVKFSGGRSSGMLLLTLLENNILNPERGDAIVFNNTSAEHPQTYLFAQECKRITEEKYNIPFFWIEFQTYEDSRQGEWTRLPTYRLINSQPFSAKNPEGFHWKGEVFEELLSFKGYVPNQFSRICTVNMKLETTRLFLSDWLAAKDSISRLGHYGDRSRMNYDEMHERHLKNGGGVPKEIYANKKSFLLTRPFVRPSQQYKNFSKATQKINNPVLESKIFGGNASFGDGKIEYVTFVGLRGDEPRRVKRVELRNASDIHVASYGGEYVYMPLSDMRITKEDVINFWQNQSWDLSLSYDSDLSNCIYCFLKGTKKLINIHKQMKNYKNSSLKGFGSTTGTPCDIGWWVKLEEKYGRNLQDEKRERKNEDVDFVGFFLSSNKLSYEVIARSKDDAGAISDMGSSLPCDCTD